MGKLEIHGTIDPRFERVRTELERNFSDRGEVGAAVHAVVGGTSVVDLWGGLADPTRGVPWREANRMGPGILLNDRAQSLIDALYDSLA